jgi:hypothetical protein
MKRRQRARRQDQAAIGGLREGRDVALDLGRVAQVNWGHVHANRRRHGLDDCKLADPGGYGCIPNDGRSRHARRDLLEQFRPFPAQNVFEHHKAGSVAARPRQTFNVAGADRIGDDRKYDRHGAGCLKQWPHRRAASSEDDVRRKCDQFRRVVAYACGIACTPADVETDVAVGSPAQLLQPLQECRVVRLNAPIVCVGAVEHADAPHMIGLLRACCERPRRRAAEHRNKFPPTDVDGHLTPPPWDHVRRNVRQDTTL